jgi:uncharacterized protein (TIGR02147 family)
MDDYLAKMIRHEYENRKLRNPSYSLRAFAKFLGVGIASLSDLLKGKRGLSPKNKVKVAEKLNFSPEQKRVAFLKKIENPKPILEEEVFKLIADWYHYGVLALCEIESHKTAPSWVAKKLGITTIEAKEAISRLIKLNLIERKNNKFVLIKESSTTTNNIPSIAIRKRHTQILEKAKEAIINKDINERFFFETTLAIDPKNIELAQELVTKYMRKVCKKLENGNQSEVYTLTTGLFPLNTKID